MIVGRRHGFRGRPLSYNVIERAARAARTALLPHLTAIEAVPGLQLFENLDELRRANANSCKETSDWRCQTEIPIYTCIRTPIQQINAYLTQR